MLESNFNQECQYLKRLLHQSINNFALGPESSVTIGMVLPNGGVGVSFSYPRPSLCPADSQSAEK